MVHWFMQTYTKLSTAKKNDWSDGTDSKTLPKRRTVCTKKKNSQSKDFGCFFSAFGIEIKSRHFKNLFATCVDKCCLYLKYLVAKISTFKWMMWLIAKHLSKMEIASFMHERHAIHYNKYWSVHFINWHLF